MKYLLPLLCLTISASAFAQDASILDTYEAPTPTVTTTTERVPSSVANKFTCTATDGGLFGSMNPIIVSVSGETITISYDNGSRKGTAELDHKYVPRGNDKNQVRFAGELESLIDESGSVEAIASSNILTAHPSKPFVKLQWKGESFESSFYSCN